MNNPIQSYTKLDRGPNVGISKEESTDKQSLWGTLFSNLAPHIFCCVIPNALAQSVNIISYFMHSTPVKVGMAVGMPIAAAWIVEPIVRPYVEPVVDSVLNLFNKNKEEVEKHTCSVEGCGHNHQTKFGDPRRLNWWLKDARTALTVGYCFSALWYTQIDPKLHNHASHTAHDHSQQEQCDDPDQHQDHDHSNDIRMMGFPEGKPSFKKETSLLTKPQLVPNQKNQKLKIYFA